jgi:hypothetical protein
MKSIKKKVDLQGLTYEANEYNMTKIGNGNETAGGKVEYTPRGRTGKGRQDVDRIAI